MTKAPADRDASAEGEAAAVAALFAIDPAGLGGIALRAGAGPQRDAWLAQLRGLLPAETPWRRMPLHIGDGRLLGGLDLAATLQAGRPISQRGLLAEADGGVVVVAMAERTGAGTAARLAAVLDTQQVVMERDGLGERRASRIGVVALDEGIGDEEGLPARWLDRFAFRLALPLRSVRFASGESDGDRAGDGAGDGEHPITAAQIAAAREHLPRVQAGDGVIDALCAAALALGIASIRAPWLALRAACAAAALDGRHEVTDDDAALAARLVLAPRATQLPVAEAPPQEQDDTPTDNAADEPLAEPSPAPPPDAADPPPQGTDADDDQAAADDAADAAQPPPATESLDDLVLEAAIAAIPPGLLAALMAGPLPKSSAQRHAAGAGLIRHGQLRGRPSGVRRGEPRAGARLNLIETLRAAAPWQLLRRREAEAKAAAARSEPHQAAANAPHAGPQGAPHAAPHAAPHIHVRREDFHVTHFKQRSETTTVFAVDASGSAALHRLAEAKGAVELLLADCYVRRDSVAVLGFRGKSAELLLPPTRSLVRAKRSLAGLPGGGGTPLAAGIDAAHDLADAVRRRGGTAVIVLLTDGRANIARDGAPGRARATEDAAAAAKRVQAAGFRTLLLDTSPQPQESGRQLARDLGALYLPLPHAGAAAMSQVVRAVSAAPA